MLGLKISYILSQDSKHKTSQMVNNFYENYPNTNLLLPEKIIILNIA